MNNLYNRIDDVLTSLYDYDYINIEKFYNDKDNSELLDTLQEVSKRGYPKFEDMEFLQELYDNIDGFIKFETNYNSEIGDF
jgi:hypothetical protein